MPATLPSRLFVPSSERRAAPVAVEEAVVLVVVVAVARPLPPVLLRAVCLTLAPVTLVGSSFTGTTAAHAVSGRTTLPGGALTLAPTTSSRPRVLTRKGVLPTSFVRDDQVGARALQVAII